ncbi:MAG: glutaredoxin family protein [Thiohalomonadales bacterium]
MIVKAVREGLGRFIVLVNYLTRPTKIERPVRVQQEIDASAKALSLYQFYACPFCVKTRRTIHRLNVPISFVDAQGNQQNREDLLTGGGAIKVPCLRIDENNKTTWMYESNNIISYLNDRFDDTKQAGSAIL